MQVLAIIFLAYILISLSLANIFTQSSTNYYIYLIDAILNGRLYVLNPPATFDLSLFQGKWFLYWGPSPILYIFPFYLIWGLKTSDVLFTLIAGFLNIILFYFVLEEFIRYFKPKISKFMRIFLLLNFAFISPNFYLSVAGRVWHAEQIISMFYLLICYYLFFRYLNTKKLFTLFLSVIFFNLAWTSRYTLLFSGFLFLYPFLLTLSKNSIRKAISILSVVILPCIFFGLICLGYNLARFHDPFQTGHEYQKGSLRYDAYLKNHQSFSVNYVPHNLFYYFINPIPNFEGTSMFVMYPSILFIFFLLNRKIVKNIIRDRKLKYYLFSAGLVILASITTYILFNATGWTQVGLRYLFDIIPLLYLTISLTLFLVPNLILRLILMYFIPVHIVLLYAFYL